MTDDTDIPYRIRRATLDDIDTLIYLRTELLREVGNLQHPNDEEEVAQANRKYLISKIPTGKFVAWVAESGEGIIAIVGLVFYERPPLRGNLSGREVYVMNVYTLPNWRGKGIAASLIAASLDFVKTTDARRIWLRATREGEPVYRKAGFVPITMGMEMTW